MHGEMEVKERWDEQRLERLRERIFGSLISQLTFQPAFVFFYFPLALNSPSQQ
jgi:hypothetical protein